MSQMTVKPLATANRAAFSHSSNTHALFPSNSNDTFFSGQLATRKPSHPVKKHWLPRLLLSLAGSALALTAMPRAAFAQPGPTNSSPSTPSPIETVLPGHRFPFFQSFLNTLQEKGLTIPAATENTALQAEVPNLGGRQDGNSTLSLRYNQAGNFELTARTPVQPTVSLESLQNVSGLRPNQVRNWYRLLSSSLVQRFELNPTTLEVVTTPTTGMEQQTAQVVKQGETFEWQVTSSFRPIANNSAMATRAKAANVATGHLLRMSQAANSLQIVPFPTP